MLQSRLQENLHLHY